ncbi:hypothetical protein ACLZRP_05675 [Klebsiella pneumoniae]|uniref:hypothetical protein n=1 Tax=Klebsiella pneumoniae complex TaxID=3390273 RepID=UPI0012EAEC46|nr:hypothetical protein [Klebsiella pneumoniae]MDP0873508.1 hypothetical protein [Klebsiella pneumoniae]MDP1061572.1 hypothetical protein [Klebsiella pneumoniae]MDP1129378.1 hypothetical protein [Klebsiella pneumoniae]MDP1480564.1 hypothetical protein [Klebsiella pneumoniae]MDP1490321.1 hypothetical protein [Klebsiella pneumoniae]
MSPEDFIRKHITAALEADLLPSDAIRVGVERALDYYRRMSQSTKKGSCFADCLFRARQWALGQTTTAERKAAKKKPGRADGVHPGLF